MVDISHFDNPSLYGAVTAEGKKSEADKALKKQRAGEDLAGAQWARYLRARDNGHIDYANRAKKNREYVTGDQWDSATKAELDAQRRPWLTLNKVLPTTMTVVGEFTNRLADFHFRPKRDASEDVATALSKIFRQIMADEDFVYKEAALFLDGLIEERGYWDVRISQDENFAGEVSLKVKSPGQVVLDPDANEYDPRTWSEVTEVGWMSFESIKATYGKDKAEQLRSSLEGAESYTSDAFDMRPATFGETSEHVDASVTLGSGENRYIAATMVLSRQYYRLVPTRLFVDPATGDSKPVPDTWSPERVEAFAQKVGLAVVNRVQKRVRWTITAGDRVVLHDDWSPYETFTVIPFFPLFTRGNPVGFVTQLLSPQDQLNKLASQELHVINTTANSGWKVEQGALVNMQPDQLASAGSKAGLVLVTAPGRKDDVEKIQPNQIPSGIANAAEKARYFIEEISNIGRAMLGRESAEMAGVALESNVARGQVSLAPIFHNLEYTRILLARKVLELIQNFYTEERLFHILGDDEENMAAEEVAINQVSPAGEILNDVTKGKYVVRVKTTPRKDVMDDQQFSTAIQLREAGLFIPDDEVIRVSPLAGRARIADRVARHMGWAEPTEQEQQMMAQQQEIQMRADMLALKRSEAEIGHLHAQTVELHARAQERAAGYDKKLEELEADIQKKREELEARIKLALIAADSKEYIAEMNNDYNAMIKRLDHMQNMLRTASPNPQGDTHGIGTRRLPAEREPI